MAAKLTCRGVIASVRIRPMAALLLACGASGCASIQAKYDKLELRIPMRDGVRLFTSVYIPKEGAGAHPILLFRTPYSVAPYGPGVNRPAVGPSSSFDGEGYIVVYQDVRGRFMSEGEFVNMRPQIDVKRGPKDVDESSDTYDTIDWLVKNLPHNNGRVGLWGISYPGFYAAAGAIDSHAALKAVSPQAPIADWFAGDDFHHNGALYLMDAFHFFSVFGLPRPTLTTTWPPERISEQPDAYTFYQGLGPLANANRRYFKGDVGFWNDILSHGSYDAFWQSRNLLPHLRNIRAAVMTVGGWFDAEDFYGPLNIYREIESHNPGIANSIVIGPWSHGGWARTDGDSLGDIPFGGKQSVYYREHVELPFFNHYLKDDGNSLPPEALVFCTGSNVWLSFTQWPPPGLASKSLYFRENGALAFSPPDATTDGAFDEYVSDPAKPVPYTSQISTERGRTYMTEDQRFAARRPDVLVYQTVVLADDLAVAGPIHAELQVSSTGSDADFVVKVIDVFPDDAPDAGVAASRPINIGGYQMLLRAEVMRAKFRGSLERPEPLTPGQITPVRFELRDVCHTFKKGHRVMVQVQSSWFPLVDRNPQRFCDIYRASDADFQKATLRVHRSAANASRISVGVRGE